MLAIRSGIVRRAINRSDTATYIVPLNVAGLVRAVYGVLPIRTQTSGSRRGKQNYTVTYPRGSTRGTIGSPWNLRRGDLNSSDCDTPSWEEKETEKDERQQQ